MHGYPCNRGEHQNQVHARSLTHSAGGMAQSRGGLLRAGAVGEEEGEDAEGGEDHGGAVVLGRRVVLG